MTSASQYGLGYGSAGPEDRPERPDPQPSWAFRQRMRALKGRPSIKGSDPLTVLRVLRRDRYADYPASMVTYGRVRAEAVSPVFLPDMERE